jgi:hypothetical protein|tara:strand:- start:880 stop:1143 length:264 start_codon:yes stop_codon:yes gene_type:complete
MKIFFYKTAIIFFLILVTFQLTVGSQLRNFERKIENLKSEENIEIIKNKLREELRNALSKERYLSKEDAELIKNFINKLNTEINLNK